MNASTLDIIKSVLRSDSTLTPADRKRLLYLIRDGSRPPKQTPQADSERRILRRSEVARILGVGLRTIDKLAAEGVIHKLRLPRRKRACGFLSSEIECLLTQKYSENG